MQAITLNRQALGRIAGPVRTPRYDPTALTPGIVHLGLGGFHRAHMARYLHELIERCPDASGWGIVGAGLLPGDERMRDALRPQDGLYTLVERLGDAETATVIGSLVDVIVAAADPLPLLDLIDRPAIRIVSLTVTEHGYCLDRSTKRLDPAHGQVAADLADPLRPRTAPGLIAEAYRRRRDGGTGPFTALSCDNIQHNGAVLRDAVLDFARLRDPALADWIAENGSFPNTMVDRITPVTTDADREHLRDRYGIDDNWPVFCERFTQWVIEDRFPAGRPALEEVGAQFVDDVAPFEFMKLRLLNGSHLAISALGRLADCRHVDETLRNPLMARYMAALMDRETGPTLPPVPGVDIGNYKRTLIERFANPGIKDTVERVNTDAPLNVLLDPIRDRLASGGSIELLSLALAAWMRRARGEDEHGRAIDVRHPLAEQLRMRAVEGGPDPRPLLSLRALFGELGEQSGLVRSVGHWLARLYEAGSLATLAAAADTLSF